MRKKLCLLLVLMLCMGTAGCGAKSDETVDETVKEEKIAEPIKEVAPVVEEKDHEAEEVANLKEQTTDDTVYADKEFNDIKLKYNSDYKIIDGDNSSFYNLIFENQKAFITVLLIDFTNEMSLSDDMVNELALSAFLSEMKYEDLIQEEAEINGISGKKATCRYLDNGVNADMRVSVISKDGKAYVISLVCVDSVDKKEIYDNEYDKILESVEFVKTLDSADSMENVSGDSKTEQISDTKSATTGQTNALRKAHDYLDFAAFSYSGLIEQLKYEKYSTEEATYAADNCGADWNEQAAKSGKQYMEVMSFSKEGLIDQLIFDGFTREQATYGAESNGY